MKSLFDEIPYLESERLVLKKIERADAAGLEELRKSESVNKYLPSFLYEFRYDDIYRVIEGMYDECFANKEALFLGIYWKETMEFIGIMELYGYRPEASKISVGYRARESFWGSGISTEAMKCTIDYLFNETDIGLITASTMTANKNSGNVLSKVGFEMTESEVEEDWGYDEPEIVYKWALQK